MTARRSSDPKPDPQLLRWIETAKAAGLETYNVKKCGREMILEVSPIVDREIDELETRIERMAGNGSE